MRRALLVLVAACRPDLGDPSSLITEPRVLAIAAEPAEVVPGSDVALTALIASPEGDVTADVAWGLCRQPTPLSSNNAVGDDCIYGATSLPMRGLAITATVPVDACSIFGPTPPPPAPGEAPRRPHDPDVTGGFYQPIRALARPGAPDQLVPAIGLARITCDLANAPLDVVRDYRARYRANTNPALVEVLALAEGEVSPGALPRTLPANTDVQLVVRWTADSAETYPVFDPRTRTLVDHREAIRASWFVSGGELAADRTGRTEDELLTFATNEWTTPAAGPAHLWVVVRDSRGGLAFESFTVQIAHGAVTGP